MLEDWPEPKIEIGGHTGSHGSEKYNLELPQRRARAVMDYLARNFSNIKPGNLFVKGYGESKPIAANKKDKGRAGNRRVELIVMNNDPLK